MFVLKKENTVSWPIEIPMPADGGEINRIDVTVEYQLLPQSRYEQLKGNDKELLRECVIGWNDDAFGVETGDGSTESLAFSADTLDQLLEFPYVRTGFLSGYWQAISGIEKN